MTIPMMAVVQPLGDSAAIVNWPDANDEEAAEQVASLSRELHDHGQGIFEAVVPAFASVTLHYSPLKFSWSQIDEQIRVAMERSRVETPAESRHLEIPVCYASEFAPDLDIVATAHGLTVQQVIALHSEAQYTVRMIGFSPGFPYLSGLPEQLATPRRSTPRLKVPAGAVAIGGRQTGIYSLQTPGGWHIIGRTPVAMFRPDLNPPCLLRAGDRVSFVSMSVHEFYNARESL